ncbi:MAG: tRNA (N6-isopentenyl adenosine(37)-C2)-methylthiotransferase MiaB, partial [Hyphomicrobiales bacterium]
MNQALPKKLFIKTYGCQMNVYDSDRMADALAPHGYEPTQDMADADLVLLNTCHIREKASEKVFSELGRLKELQNEKRATGGDLMIGVAGCVAQAEGEEIARRAPMVDMVFGPQAYHRLPDMLAKAEKSRHMHPALRRAVVDTDFPEEDKFAHLPAAKKDVTIGRGLT